jgi:glycosyltransferase involved in cell wall biosynthesis
MRKTLSVVVTTKNEEDKIARCLESVKWADEIVIVDGFSTDRTVEICRQYTDKIIQHKCDGNFDKERNLGIDNATGDWVLQLDADDVVTDRFRQEIEKILSKETVEFNAYKFRRKNFFLGHFMRWGGWYHYSLHFFRRGYARYRGKIHETLIVNGKIGRIEADVEHYPYKSISQFIERHNSYSNRVAQAILEQKGVLSQGKIKYNLTVKPLKLFWKFYIKKKGFREGTIGLIFSVLFAWVHFLNWVKYWESGNLQKGRVFIG